MRRIRQKLNILPLLGAALLLFSLCCPALAAGSVDVGASCAITVDAVYGTLPLPGAELKLHRVAEVDPAGQYTLLPDFSGSGVQVNGLTLSRQWAAAAADLAAWVRDSSPAPLAVRTTDSAGRARFTRLSTGPYLLEGTSVTVNGRTYTASPVLLSAPLLGENGTWYYDVTTCPKFERGSSGGDPDTPVEPPDPVDPTDPVAPPDPVDPPGPVDPTDPTDPIDPEKPDKPSSTDDDLPQTGQLKWPVPVLAGAGVLLLAAGALLKKRDGHE